MNKDYTGIVVEESLNDNRVLNKLDIKKIRISDDEDAEDRWHMYEVMVEEKEIMELSKHIIGDWYMHFWKNREIIAVFKDKTFTFNYDDKNTWNEVLKYGRKIGIPEEELDFPIDGL